LTANYGFFCYLTVALHVFLLDDRDLARWTGRTPTPTATTTTTTTVSSEFRRGGGVAAAVVLPLYVAISFVEGWLVFGPPARRVEPLLTVRLVYAPLRIVNTYHLFAQVTRDRIEPELQTSDGMSFTPRHLKHKPGDPARASDFVAPLQPRVDFQLWFY